MSWGKWSTRATSALAVAATAYIASCETKRVATLPPIEETSFNYSKGTGCASQYTAQLEAALVRQGARTQTIQQRLPLYKAILAHESNCDPFVVSSTGALGLMQVTPETAAPYCDVYAPRSMFIRNGSQLTFTKAQSRSTYSALLKDALKSAREAKDLEQGISIDCRVDPQRNTIIAINQLEQARTRYAPLVPAAELDMISALAHNMGAQGVAEVMQLGNTVTAQGVVDNAYRLYGKDAPKTKEVRSFYKNVKAQLRNYQ